MCAGSAASGVLGGEPLRRIIIAARRAIHQCRGGRGAAAMRGTKMVRLAADGRITEVVGVV